MKSPFGRYFSYYDYSNEKVKRKVQESTQNRLLYVI